MQACVRIAGLEKSYGSFSLRGMNLIVPAGSIVGLVGENGAGKSTTIRMLLGAVPRDAGSIQVLGMDIDDPRWMSVKEDIGVVLDECHFPETMKPQQLSKVMQGIHAKWDRQSFSSYLKRFGIPEGKRIKDFSRGTRMKLAIAVAMSHQARLLVLDEPTSGLDPLVRSEMLEIFQTFMEDESHAILLSSHIISDLEKVADYISCLHEGRLVFSESKDDLLYRYGIFKGSREQFSRIDPADFISVRENRYGVEALSCDRATVGVKYPFLMQDRLSIEEIMMHVLRDHQDGEMEEKS